MLCFNANLPTLYQDSKIVRSFINTGIYWLDEDENPFEHIQQTLITHGFCKISCENTEDFAKRIHTNDCVGTCSICLDYAINDFSRLLCYKSINLIYGYEEDNDEDNEKENKENSAQCTLNNSVNLYIPNKHAILYLQSGKNPNLYKIHPSEVIYPLMEL